MSSVRASSKNWLFFRLLLNKFFPAKQEEFLKLLQDDEKEKLVQHTFSSKNPQCLFFQPEEKLNQIHYSWLEPTINEMPEPLRSSIIHALPESTISALIKREVIPANFEHKKVAFSKSVYNFLIGKLFEKWQKTEVLENEILPKELLPKSDLAPLLQTSKVELMDLIDLLCMHDLAEEVRHIVDKKLLHAIISKLSTAQQKYLRTTLHQKPKMSTNPLQVKEIYKDSKKFLHLLHKRGIQRLGFGLSGSHPDFIWYITHMLDIGRGKLLMSFIQSEEIPTTTQVVKIQILQILQQLNAKESK
jgi:hypothetical protein